MDIARRDQFQAAAEDAWREFVSVAQELVSSSNADAVLERCEPGVDSLLQIIREACDGPTRSCMHADSPRPLHVVVAVPNTFVCTACLPLFYPLALQAEAQSDGCDVCDDIDYARVIVHWGNLIVHGRICNACSKVKKSRIRKATRTLN